MSENVPPPRSSRRRRLIQFAAAALGLACAVSSVLFVDETELVIVERLGAISRVYDRDEDRGLHFKLPWPLETARGFDRRVQLLNLPAREILTRDKKNITLDAYVSWRIAQPEAAENAEQEDRPAVRFFRSLGDKDIAAARLESRLNSVLSAKFGQVELDHLLEARDSSTAPGDSQTGLLQQLADEIKTELESPADSEHGLGSQLGIEVVAVGFERLSFPEGNRSAVYERMRSERRKIANRYRAEGEAESKVIRSQAELWATTLLARAGADAERIRGEAEAEATRVLNTAHLEDPEFYRVLRTLDGYRKIIHPNTTLVLSASSRLLRLLSEGIPESPADPPVEPESQ